MIMLLAFLTHCGPRKQDEEPTDESPSTVTVVAGSAGAPKTTRIPIRMMSSSHVTEGLGLADPTAYTVELGGCISGYTTTVDQTEASIEVYKFDRDCKARLTSLVLDGRTLIPTSGDPFTTWDVDDVATFDEVGEPGTWAVTIRVIEQLDSPVSGTETITYRIFDNLKGGDNDAEVPPIAISGATCCTTNTLKANGVELTLTWSPFVAAYDHVLLRRKAGTSAPSATDCTSDDDAGTLTDFSTDTYVYTDDTGLPGQTFSYRACAVNSADEVIETATVTNLSSAEFHWLFVRSTTYANGGFGIATANSNCQTAGASIDATLSWVALLSDRDMEASGRVPVSGKVYSKPSAGAPVEIANGYSGFWGGSLVSTSKYYQTGAAAAGNAWTGTTSAGARETNNCENWTSSASTVNGRRGTVTSATATWLTAGNSTCNTATIRTYCVSKTVEPLAAFTAATPASGADGDVELTLDFPDDTTGWTKLEIYRSSGFTAPACGAGTLVTTYNGPVFTDGTYTDATGVGGTFYSYRACLYRGSDIVAQATTRPPGRSLSSTPAHLVFTTFGTWNGARGGLAAVDALCQFAGNNLVSGRTWIAIVSTSTTAASSRISTTSEIRNPMGQLVASSSADLFDGTLTNAIRYNEFGGDEAAQVTWTGTTSAGAAAANTCLDWTSGVAGNSGGRGTANVTTASWTAAGNSTCNGARAFYCFSVED